MTSLLLNNQRFSPSAILTLSFTPIADLPYRRTVVKGEDDFVLPSNPFPPSVHTIKMGFVFCRVCSTAIPGFCLVDLPKRSLSPPPPPTQASFFSIGRAPLLAKCDEVADTFDIILGGLPPATHPRLYLLIDLTTLLSLLAAGALWVRLPFLFLKDLHAQPFLFCFFRSAFGWSFPLVTPAPLFSPLK